MDELPTDDTTEASPSLLTGCGCALIFIGAMTLPFSVSALAGVSERINLDLFGVPMNDPAGRALWVAGGLLALTLGVIVLWKRPRP